MNDNRLRSVPRFKSGFFRAAAPLIVAATALLGFGITAQAADYRVGALRAEAVRFDGDGGWREGNRYEERQFSMDALSRLQDRIDWAQSRGALSAREADRLQERADDLRNRARAYWRSGGIDRQEGRELDDRFQDLRADVRRLVWDREYRGDYRKEWRERSLWGENGWRGDGYRSQPDLRGSQADRDDFDSPDLGKAGPPNAPQAAPKQFDPPRNVSPGGRSNSSSAAPSQNNRSNQPFQDGRDFH